LIENILSKICFLLFHLLFLPKKLAKIMKKALLIALLLIPFLGIAQTTKPIDSFLGIKFGSSKAVVLAAMKAKGATMDKENSKVDFLDFDNVKLGHRAAVDFNIKFVNDKVYAAVFVFKAEDNAHTVEYYNALVSDINDNYGKGVATKEFKSPFKEGDGNLDLAIESGHLDIFTDWKGNTGSIQASITNKFEIILIYQDDKLDEEATAKQKAKEKSEF
jgi:hypothetical protein